jgi:hypothetical protein
VAGCSLLLPPVDRLAMLIVAAFLMGSNEGIGVFLVNGFMASLHPDSPSAAFAVLRFVGEEEAKVPKLCPCVFNICRKNRAHELWRHDHCRSLFSAVCFDCDCCVLERCFVLFHHVAL